MSNRKDEQIIDDIKESIRRIELCIGEITYSEFKVDIKTQDSVIRNIEIIGEAVSN